MAAIVALFMARVLTFCTVVLITTLMSAQISAQDKARGNLVQGQKIANQSCGRCHNVGLQGTSSHPSAPLFRRLSDKWPLESLEEALAEGISVGHEDMPEFRFEVEEIDSLLAYITRINDFEVLSR